MKTYRVIIFAIVVALLASCSDNAKVKLTYEHPERYSIGNATIEQHVKSISIDWLCGEIDIRYSDNTELRIYEEISDSLSSLADSLRMRYYVDEDGELDIQYCGAGKFKYGDLNALSKHLFVEVPHGISLDEIDIDGVQSMVRVVEVQSRELTVDGVKVNVNAYYPDTLPDEIDLDGVSCLLAINVRPTAGLTIEMSGVKPQLSCDLPSMKEGDKTIVGDGQCKVDADGVSVKLCVGELN